MEIEKGKHVRVLGGRSGVLLRVWGIEEMDKAMAFEI